MKRLLALVAFLFASAAQAATYYVDCTAPNDKGAGTSPETAWQTIDKVNRSSFQPGDFILFKRGCTWHEQLVVPSPGSAGHPITFGAYGSGASPIINGSTLITPGTSWSDEGSNVWSATAANMPEQVFFDGAHFGNKVANLGALASEYDWYHDGSTTLYVYSPTDPDTRYTSPGVECAYQTRGIFSWLQSYITVQDLTIERTGYQSILNVGGKGWTVKNVSMLYSWNEGMRNWGNDVNTRVDDLTVTGCTISYTGGEGIYAGNFGVNGVISGNSIEHACLSTALDYTAGIKIWSGPSGSEDPDNVSGFLIEKNVVSYCGDGTGNRGAGIWCDTSSSNIVRYNRVHDNQLVGILIEKGNSNQVYGNVIYNHTAYLSGNGGRGIMLSMNLGEEECNDNLIYSNTAYNSRQSLVFWGAGSTHSISNNIVKNNIFLTSSEDDISYLPQGRDSGNVFAYNCLGPNNIKVNWNRSSKTTYAAWETAYGSTTHSVQSDPFFTNAPGGEFTLLAVSPCIDAGADLGPSCATALLPGSSWPGNVMTGDQRNAGQWWEIGAYVFPGGLAASFTVSPDTPTQGQPVQFTDTSTGATTWNWDFGDGTRSMGRNPVHTYADRGSYTVVLWVSNGVNSSQAVKTVTTATVVRKHLPKR